jgi:putative phosphoesterase
MPFLAVKTSIDATVLRIVVMADIHSNLDSFRAVIAHLPKYDHLFFLGDLIGYGPQPDEVIEQLQRLQPSIALMGNHDFAVLTGDTSGFSEYAKIGVEWTRQHIKPRNLRYLSTLSPYARIKLDNTEFALFHGSPRDPLGEYVFPGFPAKSVRQLIQEARAKIVLLGHTHLPMVYTLTSRALANPGSVGQPRDGDPRAAFAILTLLNGNFSFEIRRVKYDIDSVATKILQERLPEPLAKRLYSGT